MNRLISFARLPIFAVLLLAIAGHLFAAPLPHRTPPRIGQQSPGFALLDQNRRRVSLAEASGTKVILVFYRGYW